MRLTHLHALLVLALLLCVPASAGAAPRVYLADYFGTTGVSVSGYDRAEDGSLSVLTGSPFEVVAGPPPFPVSGMIGLGFVPDGSVAVSSYLFKGGASSASVAENGSLTPIGAPITTPSVTGLAVSPDGRFAYVPTRDFIAVPAQGIIGVSIGEDGSLSPLAGSPFGGATEVGDVAVTPDGNHLFAAGVGGGIRRFSIAADGSLSENLPAVGAPVPVMSLVPSPDGQFLFAARATSPDSVASYSIGQNGSLTVNGTPVSAGENSLGYFDVSPDGRQIYMPESNSDSIVRASVAENGVLAVAGSTPAEDIDAVGVAPDGEYLYLAEDSSAGTISVARINADGSLEILPSAVPWDSGEPERVTFAPGVTPVASFDSSPGKAGSDTSFDAGDSQDAARFDWDFGDGSELLDGGPSPVHVYDEAGSYTVRLTVADPQGCSVSQIYSGQSTRCQGGPEAGTESTIRIRQAGRALRITNLRLSKKTIKPRARRRAQRVTEFRYRVSEPARIMFTARRKVFGRRAGGECRRATTKNQGRKRCVLRLRRVGSIRRSAAAGANRTRFTGKVRKRSGKRIRLKPGRYRMTAVAIGDEGSRSRPASVDLRVLRGRGALADSRRQLTRPSSTRSERGR